MNTQQMPSGSYKLPGLDEFSVYVTNYYHSYVNWQGKTITYKLITPERKRVL